MNEKKSDKNEEWESWRKKALTVAWNIWVLGGRNSDLFYILQLYSLENPHGIQTV